MRAKTWIPALMMTLLAVPAVAQDVGTKLPPFELEDLTQTPAKTFEDYLGRAVLIEFFAYW